MPPLSRLLAAVSPRGTAFVAAGVLLTAAAANLLRLGDAPVYHYVEGAQALLVREVVERGEWVLPRANGDTLPSKPLLYTWLAALASHAAGGVSETTVRLPAALAACGTVTLTFVVGRPTVGAPAALAGALMALASPQHAKEAREATTDALLSFWVAAALTLAWRMHASGRWSGAPRAAFFVAVAAAVLTKGPVGAVLPALAVGAFLVWTGSPGRARELVRGGAWALAVVPPALWYALAFADGGRAFVEKQVLDENLQRFAGGFGSAKPVHHLVVPFVQDALPWTVLFLAALAWTLRTRQLDDGRRFLLSWWGAVFVFFSLAAGKRGVYLLPLLPPTVLLAADLAWRLPRGRPLFAPAAAPGAGRRRALALGAGAALLTVAGAAAGVGTPWPAWTGDAAEPFVVALSVVRSHPLAAAAAFGAVAAGVLHALSSVLAGERREAVLAVVAAAVAFYVLLHPLGRAAHKERRSVRAFGLAAARLVPPDAPLAFHGYTEREIPGFLYFYVGRRVPSVACASVGRSPECPPGYYFAWARAWERHDAAFPPAARVLARSDVDSPAARYEPIVLLEVPPAAPAERLEASAR